MYICVHTGPVAHARMFNRFHRRNGCVKNRASTRVDTTTQEKLERMNLGECTAFTPEERAAYRVSGFENAVRVFVHDVFSGSSSRTLYLSRVERNRLVHSENGNTPMTAAEIMKDRLAQPASDKTCRARTFQLTQCSKRPAPGHDLCSLHLAKGCSKHGRMGNRPSETLKREALRNFENVLKK